MGNVIELVSRERTYTGREVAELLGIGASTLRKWSMLLEQHGYWFLRDNQNWREYRRADIAVLQRFYQLTKDELLSQEEAALLLVNQEESEAPSPATVSASLETATAPAPRIQPQTSPLELQVRELAAHVKRQDAAHAALLERIEKQEAYIRSSLKERDRRLTKAMSDIMDTKAQIAKMKEEKRKTSIWHKLLRLN